VCSSDLLMTLCGLGALAAIWATMWRLTGESRMAAAITLTTALSLTFYESSHRILTEAPFALVLWGMIYCLCRYASGGPRWLAITAIASLWAVVLRGPGVVVIGPLALGVLLDRTLLPSLRKRAWAAAALLAPASLAAAGFWALARTVSQRQPDYAQLIPLGGIRQIWARLSDGLPLLAETLAKSFSGHRSFWPLGVVVLILAILGGIKMWRRGARLAPVALGLYLPGLCLLMSRWGMNPRYLVPVCPLLAWMTFEGAGWVAQMASRRKPAVGDKWRRVAISSLVLVAILSNLATLCREAFFYSYRRFTWAKYLGRQQPLPRQPQARPPEDDQRADQEDQ
jgi:hypothetical protein